MTGQPPWLTEAWREFGQSEITGTKDNPRITAFFKELGHEEFARDEVAWCAAFVGACLERAGLKSTRSLMARSYTAFGENSETERIGAVAVLRRGNNPAFGHVGFLLGWSDDRLWLLGGNQRDAVTVAPFSRDRLVALRWPTVRQVGGLRSADTAETGIDVFGMALKHVLEMEGGFTDDPHDPGGPTNLGITLETLAAWRGLRLTPANRNELVAALKSIASTEVEAIYHEKYWKPARCAELPSALAFFHFDTAVNHGVMGATRLLQEAVLAEVDGEIGPETLKKVEAMPLSRILERYAEARRRKYRSLPHFWRFGRGWLRRVDRTLQRASQLARDIQIQSNADLKPDNQEGSQNMSTTTITENPKWWGQSMTIWGAIMTAAAAILPTIGPVIGLDLNAAIIRELGEQLVAVAQAVAALVGTVLTIYGRARAVQPLMRRDVVVKI